MATAQYPLETILSTISKYKKNSNAAECMKKRTIYNQGKIGGFSSTQLILFFIALPFIEYASIFNSYVFTKLGIAQSIVVFIICLVFLMQIVFLAIWANNKKALHKITPSWEAYFPNVDLRAVLSSGVSPYSDFFKSYSLAAADKLSADALHKALEDAFAVMREENRDLLEMMEKNKK